MLSYKQRSISDLLAIVDTQDEWVKVHAAEFLLWAGDSEAGIVKSQFEREDTNFGDRAPYRIGIWRVLAQAGNDSDERNRWIAKIVEVYSDPQSLDKLHAVETLAKLGYPVIEANHVESLFEAETNPRVLYELWNVSHHTKVEVLAIQTHLVNTVEDLVSIADFGPSLAISSYILRHLGLLPTDLWHRLHKLSDMLLVDPKSYTNVLATLWITQPVHIDRSLTDEIMQSLLGIKHDVDLVNHLFMALAAKAGNTPWDEIRSLYDRYSDSLLTEYDPDIHASAAYALIRFVNRELVG